MGLMKRFYTDPSLRKRYGIKMGRTNYDEAGQTDDQGDFLDEEASRQCGDDNDELETKSSE